MHYCCINQDCSSAGGKLKLGHICRTIPLKHLFFNSQSFLAAFKKNLISSVKPHYHTMGPPCSWAQSSNAQKWNPATVPVTKGGNLQNGLCIPHPPSLGKPPDAFTQFPHESSAPKSSENPDSVTCDLQSQRGNQGAKPKVCTYSTFYGPVKRDEWHFGTRVCLHLLAVLSLLWHPSDIRHQTSDLNYSSSASLPSKLEAELGVGGLQEKPAWAREDICKS